MQRVAVACSKGGVGKTSLCVGLASAFAEVGEQVLLVDCDAQAGATRWLGRQRAPGLTAVFAGVGEMESLVVASNTERVDLVPAGVGLVTLDRTQGDVPGAENRLAEALDSLGRRYDTILLDTPPTMGHVVVCALAAATQLVVPVDARPLGLQGVQDLLGLADRVRCRHNPELGEAQLVLSRTNRTRLSRDVEREVRERYGRRVLDAPVPERVSVARASGLSLPVLVHEPSGPAATALRQVAGELRGNRWTRLTPSASRERSV